MRKRKLTKDAALRLVLEDYHWIFDRTDGTAFDRRPHSVGRVEVGWLFEFRAIRQYNEDGTQLMAKRFVVSELDESVHPVGVFPVRRIVDEILGRGFR